MKRWVISDASSISIFVAIVYDGDFLSFRMNVIFTNQICLSW